MSYPLIEKHLLAMIQTFQVDVQVPGMDESVRQFLFRDAGTVEGAIEAIEPRPQYDELGQQVFINDRGEVVPHDSPGAMEVDLNEPYRTDGVAGIAKYELLANPRDSMCFIEAGPPTDATPMGFGRTHDRFYRIEWKPRIHCLFKPPASIFDITVDDQPSHTDDRFLLSAFNATLGMRINEFLNELIRRPTLTYMIPNPDFDMEQDVSRFNPETIPKRYGIDAPDSSIMDSSQIMYAEPSVEETNIFRGESGPYNFYVGISIVHRIVEGFQLQPIL